MADVFWHSVLLRNSVPLNGVLGGSEIIDFGFFVLHNGVLRIVGDPPDRGRTERGASSLIVQIVGWRGVLGSSAVRTLHLFRDTISFDDVLSSSDSLHFRRFVIHGFLLT